MIKKLLIATKNQGKFCEITEVLQTLPLELCSLADINANIDVEETGETHEANAILKAQYFFKKTGLPTMGEDSGIYVDAFPGELGVKTRRWGKLEAATDEEWVAYFLKQMEEIPPERRGARFVCFAVIILDNASYKTPCVFSGETKGFITEKLEAPLVPGIPLSSCFKPVGATKVYAVLTAEEKNKISHRGKAMRKVKEFLRNYIL